MPPSERGDDATLCIIAVCNPVGGKVWIIMEEDGDGPHVYFSHAEAKKAVEHLPITQAWPY